MNNPPAPFSNNPALESPANAAGPVIMGLARQILILAAAAIPISLIWDFSWESTVGIDLMWAPAHVATYLAVTLVGLASLVLVIVTTRSPVARENAVRLGPSYAPMGAWLALWGALAFPTAVWFDRWWQSAYGLAAGIWHPPQLLKAVAFFAVTLGGWLFCVSRQNRAADVESSRSALIFAASGGVVLALVTVVTLTLNYPNRQHSAIFYKLACGVYPILLVATATAGRRSWSAGIASAVYGAIIGMMVWLLPLVPAKPQVAPIYHPLDHLMPPPFPLLLIVPALVIDALLNKLSWPVHRGRAWLQAGAVGLVFCVVFLGMQWRFAEFLLTDLADNRFFAGGGKHWPFFLKIDPQARVAFWGTSLDPMSVTNFLMAAVLATLASRMGLWIGEWMKRARR